MNERIHLQLCIHISIDVYFRLDGYSESNNLYAFKKGIPFVLTKDIKDEESASTVSDSEMLAEINSVGKKLLVDKRKFTVLPEFSEYMKMLSQWIIMPSLYFLSQINSYVLPVKDTSLVQTLMTILECQVSELFLC